MGTDADDLDSLIRRLRAQQAKPPTHKPMREVKHLKADEEDEPLDKQFIDAASAVPSLFVFATAVAFRIIGSLTRRYRRRNPKDAG